MVIKKAVIDIINASVPDTPPETGGILGSSNGVCIDKAVMDIANPMMGKQCSYAPDVVFLNRSIAKWQRENISFMGIFHTHFFGVKSLSVGDKEYITAIMNAMPRGVEYLYFPIFVLPERQLVCYKAKVCGASVNICAEEVTVE